MTLFISFIAALGCGLVAGVFFAFSSFVMPALQRLGNVRGVAAMQSINTVVLNSWFLWVLLGTALACAALVVASLYSWSVPGARLSFWASLLYLVGAIGITKACNVPLNEALAKLTPDSAEAAVLWPRFVAEWSNWNLVRAGAALSASALLVLSMLRMRPLSMQAPVPLWLGSDSSRAAPTRSTRSRHRVAVERFYLGYRAYRDGRTARLPADARGRRS